MEKITKKITSWLVYCEAITEVEKDLYEYAVYSILLTISPIFLALVYGIVLGAVWQSILIILPFVVIRKYSGGYHAKSSRTCFASSSLLLIMCITFSKYIKCNYVLLLAVLLSAMSLICFSPIENENRKLSIDEKFQYKKIVFIIVVIFILIDIILNTFHFEMCVKCISIGVILPAGLQIPCIIGDVNK